MNPDRTNRTQRQQAIQERILKNRNLLGKASPNQETPPHNIL